MEIVDEYDGISDIVVDKNENQITSKRGEFIVFLSPSKHSEINLGRFNNSKLVQWDKGRNLEVYSHNSYPDLTLNTEYIEKINYGNNWIGIQFKEA